MLNQLQHLQQQLQASLIETHISWVLLDGTHAWKIKKPVRLSFLDFSELSTRQRLCEVELQLNRRLAPEKPVARIALTDVPLPATVVFASFTGEEAGLLGSREFVRIAAEKKWNVVGALNNDMIGWAGESSRMDNTIRYSNAGIRDIQHGASFLFTNLILYDAKYYKGTDANAFYDGWGDIVGGLGSYPVLANPNYHQPTDLFETISFRQIAETAKVTAATLTTVNGSTANCTLTATNGTTSKTSTFTGVAAGN